MGMDLRRTGFKQLSRGLCAAVALAGLLEAPYSAQAAPASHPSDAAPVSAANDDAPRQIPPEAKAKAATPDAGAASANDDSRMADEDDKASRYTVASQAAAGLHLKKVPQDLRSPSIALDGLFATIGGAHIFPDFKAVADATPDEAPQDLVALWRQEKTQPGFSLSHFVHDHFTFTPAVEPPYTREADENVRDYINGMWPVLTRGPDKPVPYSSLLPLPRPYVVPGGRFTELYYWDSYFTMIGLAASDRFDLLRDMVQDMASLIDRYGKIPNGTRTYYLSRSQPPFFSLMVALLADHDGPKTMLRYLPEMQKEYDYWMDGEAGLKPGHAYRHVLRLEDGTVLNRYWDDLNTPRDESYPEDIATAKKSVNPPGKVYRDLRAAAESGWDFSSRWLADPMKLSSIHTTDLAPVDLNSLMAHMESVLAHAYKTKGEDTRAASFDERATSRGAAMTRLMWNQKHGAFFDFDWKSGKQTSVLSAATVVPLFLHLATDEQADGVAKTVADTLLGPGGIRTTDQKSGQQWDAPNGWAPLQWMTVQGLRLYGHDGLAREVAKRWMTRVMSTYSQSGVLLEKYDVSTRKALRDGGKGGGEYPMQVGFGWTNGTLEGLLTLYPQIAAGLLDDDRRAKTAHAIEQPRQLPEKAAH